MRMKARWIFLGIAICIASLLFITLSPKNKVSTGGEDKVMAEASNENINTKANDENTKNKNDADNQETKAVNNNVDCKQANDVEIKQKIVFIKQVVNWSFKYTNYGYFIDRDGNKVEFDLSKEDKRYAEPIKLLEHLNKLEYQDGKVKVPEATLKQNYQYLYHIDENAKIETASAGADRGSQAYYGVKSLEDGSERLILLSEEGDWKKTNTDEYAKQIVPWLKEIDELN